MDAHAPEPRVEFTLPAKAANVPLVRHALAGLAELLGMDAAEIADLKTVVTEACMNAAIHAYPDDEEGPLEVAAWREGGELVVRVRDYGEGIRPIADVEHRSLRLGLPLIAALADSFSISGRTGSGTEVTMRLALARDAAEPAAGAPDVTGETRVRITAGEALAPVLSRLVSMLAARADFSVDRLSDAVLLGDAIAAHGPDGFPDGTARLAVREEDGAFTIRFGPLDRGGGARLIEGMRIPILDASLEELADEVRTEGDGDGEYLLLKISQPRG